MADRAEDLASVMLDLLLRTDYANEARFRTLAAEQLASMESAVRHSRTGRARPHAHTAVCPCMPGIARPPGRCNGSDDVVGGKPGCWGLDI
eukprot:SAG25_NODE_3340_length_1123_cov_1.209961_2_plen_91_part_00